MWENRIILKEFLGFLADRQIKPVIVVMPAVKGYVDGVPAGCKERFYESLSKCAGDVQILDYFGNYYGNDSDYYYVSHFIPTNVINCRPHSITSERIGNSELKAAIKCVHKYNKEGAEKFTEKLIRDIRW